MTILQANVAAALDKKQISRGDKKRLEQYARHTAPGYCAGCANICESAVDFGIPISDIMRYLMYARCYWESERAKSAFNGLPSKVRRQMKNIDYREVERKCPQRMQIGRLMKEAAIELA